MNKLILLLALFVNTCFTHAQTSGTIRGVIHDSETGEPVLFAKVIVSNTDSIAIGGAYTDVDGFFIISNLTNGKYYLTINDVEHETKIVSDVELEPKGLKTLRILMDKKEQVPAIIIMDGIHCGGPKKIDSVSIQNIKTIPSEQK